MRQSSIIFLPLSQLLYLPPKSKLKNRNETCKFLTTAILRNLCNKVCIHPYTISRHSDTQFKWESGVEQSIIKSTKLELRQHKTMQTTEDYRHQSVKDECYESNEEFRNLLSQNSVKVFECREMGSAKYVGRVLDEKRLYNYCS